MEESWGDHFPGTPFQGLGNVLDALYPGGAEMLVENLPRYLKNTYLESDCLQTGFEGETALLQYPPNSSCTLGILFYKKPDWESAELISVYPVLQGFPNRLQILNYKAWDNNLEGMIACCTQEQFSIAFFNPFYFVQKNSLPIGSTKQIDLSAVAFSLSVAEAKEIELKKGDFYNLLLADFLNENPDKTENDFKKPVINFGPLHMLISTGYTGEYQYRSLVIGREETEFLGEKIFRYRILFNPDSHNTDPELWLYAAPHHIKGRTPLIGDYIEGILWLEGFEYR